MEFIIEGLGIIAIFAVGVHISFSARNRRQVLIINWHNPTKIVLIPSNSGELEKK